MISPWVVSEKRTYHTTKRGLKLETSYHFTFLNESQASFTDSSWKKMLIHSKALARQLESTTLALGNKVVSRHTYGFACNINHENAIIIRIYTLLL